MAFHGIAWLDMTQYGIAQHGTGMASYGMAHQDNDKAWHDMVQDGMACPMPRGTWWRCQAELAQERDSPMQKQGRQPAGLAALRWKVPAAQESQSRPRTLGWGHRVGRCEQGNGWDWIQRVGWMLGRLVGLGTPGTRLGTMGDWSGSHVGWTGCHGVVAIGAGGIGLGAPGVRLDVMGDWSGSYWGVRLVAMGQEVRLVLGGLDQVAQGLDRCYGGWDWICWGVGLVASADLTVG